MKIRSNKILKLFATLLFLLEFLSPALAVNAQGNDLLHDQMQMHKKQNPNFWFAIYNEELTEGEETRGNEKSDVIILDFVNVLLSLTVTHTTSADFDHTQTNQQYHHQPPLFQLHCLYLI